MSYFGVRHAFRSYFTRVRSFKAIFSGKLFSNLGFNFSMNRNSIANSSSETHAKTALVHKKQHDELCTKERQSRRFLQLRLTILSHLGEVHRDVNTYTMARLISSIGGQTGLWLGASVMSVLQLLSYILCPCVHWKDISERLRRTRTYIRRKRHVSQTNNMKKNVDVCTSPMPVQL